MEREKEIQFGAFRPLQDATLMKAMGYDFIECYVGETLCPDLDERAWASQREVIRQAPLPLNSCIGLFPPRFRLTGPSASFEEPLEYVQKVCQRADELGVKTLAFGGGNVRNAPEGFPIDEAVAQFTEFCRQLAQGIESYHVTIVLETLRAQEANFLNYVWEGHRLVEAIQSPRIQLLADLYHMYQGGEGADSILQAGSLIRHVHLAESQTRRAMGKTTDGTEYLPNLSALKAIGYQGGISLECFEWDEETKEADLARSLETLKHLWALA